MKFKRKYHKRNKLIHGYTARKHPLYMTWWNMKSRCYDDKDPSFDNYGGRGITVCDRWLDFEPFALDMGLKPEKDLTLERMDNHKGYSPNNCRWATKTEQCLNRRKFKNNTSGETGIVKIGDRYHVRYDEQGVRYALGRFASISEAKNHRELFIRLFNEDKVKALKLVGRNLNSNSSTGVNGISRSVDGLFRVRQTIEGKRIYLGCSKTLKDAIAILEGFNNGTI